MWVQVYMVISVTESSREGLGVLGQLRRGHGCCPLHHLGGAAQSLLKALTTLSNGTFCSDRNVLSNTTFCGDRNVLSLSCPIL